MVTKWIEGSPFDVEENFTVPNKAIWKRENLSKYLVVVLVFRLWFKHHFDSVCDYH